MSNSLCYLAVGFCVGFFVCDSIPLMKGFFNSFRAKEKTMEEKIEEAGIFTIPDEAYEKKEKEAQGAEIVLNAEENSFLIKSSTKLGGDSVPKKILDDLLATKEGEILAHAFPKDPAQRIMDKPLPPLTEEEKAIIEERKREDKTKNQPVLCCKREEKCLKI